MPYRYRCAFLVAVVLIAACGKKESPPAQAPAAAPPASAPAAAAPPASEPPASSPQSAASAPAGVTLSSVTLGKTIGSDKKVTTSAEVFARGDTVHASVDTDGTGTASLGAKWTRDRKGRRVTMAEQTVDIAPTGPTTTAFSLARAKGLPPGDYRLEIVLDGQAVASRSFKVRDAAAARPKVPPVAKAELESPPIPRGMQPASNEQLQAASMVYYGQYNCELGKSMTLSKSRQDGYVDLRAGRRRATMVPVLSSTGAVRLEQVSRGPLLVVQIPTKSILFNQRAGKRLIDDCRSPQQKG